MICKMHGYWNDETLPDGKYHATEVVVQDNHAASLIQEWYNANTTTDGFGIRIEVATSSEESWHLLYDGPVNDIVIMGLACKLKGVVFI